MMMVPVTSLNALLVLFAAVPLGILASIYCGECASSLRRRSWRHKHH